jgi:nucleosome binding factor SPN SPT16 subunit
VQIARVVDVNIFVFCFAAIVIHKDGLRRLLSLRSNLNILACLIKNLVLGFFLKVEVNVRSIIHIELQSIVICLDLDIAHKNDVFTHLL